MTPVVNVFELVVEAHIGFGIPQIDYVESVVNDSVDGLESQIDFFSSSFLALHLVSNLVFLPKQFNIANIQVQICANSLAPICMFSYVTYDMWRHMNLWTLQCGEKILNPLLCF